MKTLFLSWAVLSVFSLGGCAASSAGDDDSGIGLDAAVVNDAHHDGATNQDSGSQGQCVMNCTSDMDCQNSCPMVPSGVNCCDTATGVCYAYAQSSCPVPVMDAGFD